MLSTPSSTIAPNASDVSTLLPEAMITWPSPASAPTNSPITAPITAREIATFRPTKMCGRAQGKRTRRNTSAGDAPSDRTSSTSSGGVALSPVAVEITIGKRHSRNVTTIFGP